MEIEIKIEAVCHVCDINKWYFGEFFCEVGCAVVEWLAGWSLNRLF